MDGAEAVQRFSHLPPPGWTGLPHLQSEAPKTGADGMRGALSIECTSFSPKLRSGPLLSDSLGSQRTTGSRLAMDGTCL